MEEKIEVLRVKNWGFEKRKAEEFEREWLGKISFLWCEQFFSRMHLFIEQGEQISTVGWTISEIQSTRWIKVALKPGKVVGAWRACKGTERISRRCGRQL